MFYNFIRQFWEILRRVSRSNICDQTRFCMLYPGNIPQDVWNFVKDVQWKRNSLKSGGPFKTEKNNRITFCSTIPSKSERISPCGNQWNSFNAVLEEIARFSTKLKEFHCPVLDYHSRYHIHIFYTQSTPENNRNRADQLHSIVRNLELNKWE